MTDLSFTDDRGLYAGGGTLLRPMRERHPDWFGKHRLITRLMRNSVRRNRKNGKRAYGKRVIGDNQVGPMAYGPLGVTNRDRAMIARRFG